MPKPMKIAISGTSGLIGSGLRDHLTELGHDVVGLVRRRPEADSGDIYWNAEAGTSGEIDGAALQGVDAVVHLAGEPIGEKRWTPEQKLRIKSSRVDGTRLLADALASMTDGPQVLVQGSAVGVYGDRGDELLPETADRGPDFLADVVVAWEAAASSAEAAGLRVSYARTGVVIAEEGPLIEKVKLPFSLGIGGVIGSGAQWVPWISLDDELRALTFMLTNDVRGPVNLVAPTPVTNRQLTKALGEVMHRPTVIPTPIFGIRALYGQMGVTLATVSQRVVPEVLAEAGFEWQQPEILESLRLALA
jgi:uncharacterized protein (TIGR01777 family)